MFVGMATYVYGQETDSLDLEVEALYDHFDQQESHRQRAQPTQRQRVVPEATSLGDLSHLEPFQDIAVIQRRYLPKTGRFELSFNGMNNLNNPFFNSAGLAFRGGYFLTEKHGLELQYFWLSSGKKTVTKNLENNASGKPSIRTANLVNPKSYVGVAYKWNPIYGKITFLNRKIVPFDLAFTVGGGTTATSYKSAEPTVHVGTGQTYALSKSMAFRWDFVWNFYNAKYLDENNREQSTNQNDLFLSVGMSFYFPEAKYR